MADDTPIRLLQDGWCIEVVAGREVASGYAFDGKLGYRVVVRFCDSRGWNSLSVEGARSIIEVLRTQRVTNEDAIALADQMRIYADWCERLNTGWTAIGRPQGGFEERVHGCA